MSIESNGSNMGQSYVVPCTSAFRNRVSDLADTRSASAADLARAIILLVPMKTIMAAPDPGGPAPDDRDSVVLQSGPSKGRVLKRKPRLQLRLPAGLDVSTIRRALGLAVEMSTGDSNIAVETTDDREERKTLERDVRRMSEELDTFRRIVDDIAFDPLPNGINTRGEALHILGFSPVAVPDERAIRSRFRKLAMIYHPDSPLGDHTRMTQLNEALDRLTRY